ncbi:hypothetical protein PROFUN_03881 [Planoprotostelium fungivorum]|uniref:Uncharacterized protein n=1 Tax=Planoprotostelium fungivorum TaxID=1890364 RepID=A0A2P6MTL4_9EUKA|nr:hypothetical protein PROFUN_03881 [Planoprotostelium fungivorum]
MSLEVQLEETQKELENKIEFIRKQMIVIRAFNERSIKCAVLLSNWSCLQQSPLLMKQDQIRSGARLLQSQRAVSRCKFQKQKYSRNSPDALAERIWRRETNVLQDEKVQDETGQGDEESALMTISWQKQGKREFIDLSEEIFIFNQTHNTQTPQHVQRRVRCLKQGMAAQIRDKAPKGSEVQQAANQVVHCNNNKKSLYKSYILKDSSLCGSASKQETTHRSSVRIAPYLLRLRLERPQILGSVFYCPFEENPSSISLGNNTPTQRFESVSSTVHSLWATIQAIHKLSSLSPRRRTPLEHSQGNFIRLNRTLGLSVFEKRVCGTFQFDSSRPINIGPVDLSAAQVDLTLPSTRPGVNLDGDYIVSQAPAPQTAPAVFPGPLWGSTGLSGSSSHRGSEAMIVEIRQLRQTIQAVRRTMPARVVRCWDIADRSVAWATLKCCSFLIILLGAMASIYRLINKLQSQIPQHSNDKQKD